MAKSKRPTTLEPGLAKVAAKVWAAARAEVRKKDPDDRRRQRLAFLAQQHLDVAKELVAIADFLMKKAN